jgi:hypothetical protein
MFNRNCPTCNKKIEYKSKYSYDKGLKMNTDCKSCYIKKSITPDRRKKMFDNMSGLKNPMSGRFGSKNPFFGKTHTETTKKKIIEKRDNTLYKSDEFRKKISNITSGENNPMFGKNFYSIWVDKFGEKVANEKMKNFKEKISSNNAGDKNPMYGKPSPNGSGNGWSGWYNGWFFRSLRELSYMILVIERFKLNWRSAENSEFTIKYTDYKKNNRTYRPDFIINEKYLVEIKPKNLWNSDSVKRKKESAKIFCESKGLVYKLVDIRPIEFGILYKMVEENKIIFTDRYRDKFNKIDI